MITCRGVPRGHLSSAARTSSSGNIESRDDFAISRQATIRRIVFFRSATDSLSEAMEMFRAGAFKSSPILNFPLERGRAALEKVATGHAAAK